MAVSGGAVGQKKQFDRKEARTMQASRVYEIRLGIHFILSEAFHQSHSPLPDPVQDRQQNDRSCAFPHAA